MPERSNTQIILAKRPVGEVQNTDFQFQESVIPALGENGILLQNLLIALDPALRSWMDDFDGSYIPPVQLGAVMSAVCLSRVVESRNPDFPVGTIVRGLAGWEHYTIAGADGARQVPGLEIVQVDEGIPLSYYLSICGTTGLTSYFGMLRVGQPRSGDTIVISGAAGAVGSVAGQIAKNNVDCRVVGIAGSAEKCRWLTEELGFDVAINYRETADMTSALRDACPQGIDVFFDNVGGEILEAALLNLAMGARIVMCGTISNYNNDVDDRSGPENMWQLLVKNARIEGFTVAYYGAEWAQTTLKLAQMVKSGELKHREQIVDGLDNTIDTFRGLFVGANHGRLMVKLAD
tara:strand:- start:867 stop:1910 length:1044 start_codon:yes stop_codon:yes gene_type:complete